MKILQNPWVTGGLALLAVGIVFFQVFKNSRAFRFPKFGGKAKPAAQAPATPGQPAAAAPTAAASGAKITAPPPRFILKPGGPIDAKKVTESFEGWVASPAHDPFYMYTEIVRTNTTGTNAPSPVPTWTLKSVLRQTDATLAVINNDVYVEGDKIQGYRLERIEDDRVWFRGTNQVLEELKFKTVPQVESAAAAQSSFGPVNAVKSAAKANAEKERIRLHSLDGRDRQLMGEDNAVSPQP